MLLSPLTTQPEPSPIVESLEAFLSKPEPLFPTARDLPDSPFTELGSPFEPEEFEEFENERMRAEEEEALEGLPALPKSNPESPYQHPASSSVEEDSGSQGFEQLPGSLESPYQFVAADPFLEAKTEVNTATSNRDRKTAEVLEELPTLPESNPQSPYQRPTWASAESAPGSFSVEEFERAPEEEVGSPYEIVGSTPPAEERDIETLPSSEHGESVGELPLFPESNLESPYQSVPDVPLQQFPWGDVPTPPRREGVDDPLEGLPSLPGSNPDSPYQLPTLPSAPPSLPESEVELDVQDEKELKTFPPQQSPFDDVPASAVHSDAIHEILEQLPALPKSNPESPYQIAATVPPLETEREAFNSLSEPLEALEELPTLPRSNPESPYQLPTLQDDVPTLPETTDALPEREPSTPPPHATESDQGVPLEPDSPLPTNAFQPLQYDIPTIPETDDRSFNALPERAPSTPPSDQGVPLEPDTLLPASAHEPLQDDIPTITKAEDQVSDALPEKVPSTPPQTAESDRGVPLESDSLPSTGALEPLQDNFPLIPETEDRSPDVLPQEGSSTPPQATESDQRVPLEPDTLPTEALEPSQDDIPATPETEDQLPDALPEKAPSTPPQAPESDRGVPLEPDSLLPTGALQDGIPAIPRTEDRLSDGLPQKAPTPPPEATEPDQGVPLLPADALEPLQDDTPAILETEDRLPDSFPQRAPSPPPQAMESDQGVLLESDSVLPTSALQAQPRGSPDLLAVAAAIGRSPTPYHLDRLPEPEVIDLPRPRSRASSFAGPVVEREARICF